MNLMLNIRRILIFTFLLHSQNNICAQIILQHGSRIKHLKNSKLIGIFYNDTLFSTREFYSNAFKLDTKDIGTSLIFKEKDNINVRITKDSVYIIGKKFLSYKDSTYEKLIINFVGNQFDGKNVKSKEFVIEKIPVYIDTTFKFYKADIKSIYTKKWPSQKGSSMVIGIGGVITTGFFIASVINLIKGDNEKLKSTGFFTLGWGGFTSYFIYRLKWHKKFNLKSDEWRIQ